MRKLLVIAGLTSALLCPVAAHAQKPRAELPTYELGDQWLRSDGVFELTRIDADRYVFTSSNNREIHLAKDLSPLKTYTNGWWVELDPPFVLKWPLEVGKWGSQTTKWKFHGAPQGNEARLQWEVKAYEDVTVAGKTLKAFRVV